MGYKRILTIQDISCVGQCSATIALPILSACGQEACLLPTTLLSTHTGGFQKPAVWHMDDFVPRAVEHWKREEIRFDAVYTGYIGSTAAVEAVLESLDDLLKQEGKLIADPAMADHGRMYSGLDQRYADSMKELCRHADILLPNITEATMLTGMPYREKFGREYAEELLEKLEVPCTVLTGVGFSDRETGAAVCSSGMTEFFFHDRVEGNFHGTGDLFASCFTGAYVGGRSVFEAAGIAAEITGLCVYRTKKNPAHGYGIRFEEIIPDLIDRLKR